MASSQGFLLPAGLGDVTLQQVAVFAVDLASVEQDLISFPEGGGDVDLELAVPFLAGMDDVVVDSARLVVRAVDAELTIDGWRTAGGPSGQGVFVILDAPSRLRRVVIDRATESPGSYLVVRAASLGAAGSPTAGTPIFADRSFSAGPMFPRPLAGLGVASSSTRATLTIPATPGRAWLVQYATGDDPAALTPAAGQPQVFDVTVSPAASDVSLVLLGDPGSGPGTGPGTGPGSGPGTGPPAQPLWQHPGTVLPDAGDQLADFTPAAGQRLSQALATLNAAGGAATLSLPLRFHAATAGTLQVRDRVLEVRYVAYPAGRDPLPLPMDGGWADLVLDAPIRAPASNAFRLRARHRGLVVNAGSGVPSLTIPPGGVRVRGGRLVAASASWQPAAGAASPSLAAVRVLASPVGETELVCDVRADAAGSPGAVVAGPLVARLAAGAPAGWVPLPVPSAVPVPGPATLWVTARTNRGELDWFASSGGYGAARASADGGTSWGDIEAGLAAPGGPFVQLLHAVDPARQAPPVLMVRIGDTVPGTITLTAGGTPGEYAGPAPAVLPAAVLAALAAPAPTPRRRTTLSLWSPDLLDLTVTELSCSYDPFAGA